MKTQRLSYQETGRFSKLVLDYINQKESVKDFISEFPTIKNFRKQIDKKSNDIIDRELLFEVLKEQNTKIDLSKSSQANLNLLKDNNTYTVTTGHQL
ncbi:MAG: bacillithiol biosynthesis BshC, partial [Pelagibacterales bacterium]|nr:bacillithiol biosynthesis BshC [Pelagibacterales bacterium]